MLVDKKCPLLKCNDSLYFYRGANELKNLYLPRMSEARETFIEDRTRAHADHVGAGFDRMTTAAVGLLKALHGGNRYVLQFRMR